MNISLFCPKEPRKNYFVQYHGFLLARRKKSDLVLETNCITDQADKFINNYGWLPRDAYENVIRNSKIVLSVFPFESLAYSVIEAIELGVLPIISPAVRDNLNLPRILVVDNVDSPIAISKKICYILDYIDYDNCLERCQDAIKELSEKNNKELKIVLENSFL